jgi:hypothetical protein
MDGWMNECMSEKLKWKTFRKAKSQIRGKSCDFPPGKTLGICPERYGRPGNGDYKELSSSAHSEEVKTERRKEGRKEK